MRKLSMLPTLKYTKTSQHGAIALGAPVNTGGDFYFLSLASGDILSHHQWTVFPVQEKVTKCVEALAIKDNQPLVQATGLVVEWDKISLDTNLSDTVNPTDTNISLYDSPPTLVEDQEEKLYHFLHVCVCV